MQLPKPAFGRPPQTSRADRARRSVHPTQSHASTSAFSMKHAARPPIGALIRVECASHDSVAGKVDASSASLLASTRWLSLSTLPYRFSHDAPGTYPRRWDVASRMTRGSSATDAVVVFARLRLGDGVTRILLVRQFRPPVGKVSVELPAGLVDEGENVEDAALRELREETGFVGVVRKVHPPASLSPGMSTETVVMVEVDVEGTTGGQMLDSGENIEVVSVPIRRLEEALAYMVERDGVVIKHAVSTLAAGIRIGTALLADD